MNTRKLLLPLGAAAILGGGTGAVAVAGLEGGRTTTTTITQAAAAPATSAPIASDSSKALTAQQIYKQSSASVAYITATITQTSASAFGQQQQSSGTATGSGFVVDPSGLIVTNNHVVEGARSIKVKVGDGATKTATVVGRDPSTDLALLKVDTGGKQLQALTFGDSDQLQVGDATFAIGNPYGLDRTLTTGVVSALHRSISAPDGYAISNVVQTDAALNPGNSGGPLLDAAGHVVGVNSQIESSSSGGGSGDSSSEGGNTGVGFAIPSDTVKRVVEQLENGGTAKHAYLGVATADDAAGDGSGAKIASVTGGGPAADALKAGDVVTAVDGKAVHDAEGLTSILDAHQPGDKVTLTVKRGGDTKQEHVTLGSRPATGGSSATQAQGDQQGNGQASPYGDGAAPYGGGRVSPYGDAQPMVP